MSLTNQCSLQSTNCKITCDMPICYAGDNTLTMQNYDCIVLHGFFKTNFFFIRVYNSVVYSIAPPPT